MIKGGEVDVTLLYSSVQEENSITDGIIKFKFNDLISLYTKKKRF